MFVKNDPQKNMDFFPVRIYHLSFYHYFSGKHAQGLVKYVSNEKMIHLIPLKNEIKSYYNQVSQ